jgi:hypothetical protein
MTDRAEVILGFESSIINQAVLPVDLVDQFVFDATIDFAYYVDDSGGRIFLEYTRSTIVSEAITVEGIWNRELINLEKRIIALFIKKGYLERNRDAIAKQIGYATKNITTKDLKSAKDGIRQEIIDVTNDIEKYVYMIITPGEYNV